jgi:hypothetical protein
MSTSGTIYRLRITLTETDPPVWRLLEVGDCSLLMLHRIMQVSMGWDNTQPWSFYIGGKVYDDTPFAPGDMNSLLDGPDDKLSEALQATGNGIPVHLQRLGTLCPG